MAAHPIGAMVTSLTSGRLGSRGLPLRVLGGLLGLFAGLFWLRTVSGYGTSGHDFTGPLLLVGGGIGTATVALFQSTLSRVPGPDAGAGAGVLQAFQQVGIALGIAIVGHLFFNRLADGVDPASYRAAMGTALLYPVMTFAALSLIAVRNLRIGTGRDDT